MSLAGIDNRLTCCNGTCIAAPYNASNPEAACGVKSAPVCTWVGSLTCTKQFSAASLSLVSAVTTALGACSGVSGLGFHSFRSLHCTVRVTSCVLPPASCLPAFLATFSCSFDQLLVGTNEFTAANAFVMAVLGKAIYPDAWALPDNDTLVRCAELHPAAWLRNQGCGTAAAVQCCLHAAGLLGQQQWSRTVQITRQPCCHCSSSSSSSSTRSRHGFVPQESTGCQLGLNGVCDQTGRHLLRS